MNIHEAFGKWWNTYCISSEGYTGDEKEAHMKEAFRAGMRFADTQNTKRISELETTLRDIRSEINQQIAP